MYDIIGDIHGYATELEQLLIKLGYCADDGYFKHKEHTAIFLGDFIDRGPEQRKVIDIVRPMVEQGSALAIMGNHEFNALAFHTSGSNGLPLRANNEKNTAQHQAFLDAYADDSDEMLSVLNWFSKLPLWLDLDGIRVVHACWHDKSMSMLESHLDANNIMGDGLLERASKKDSREYIAVEILLKGMELPLPAGISFLDKDKNPRHRVRIKWWLKSPDTFADLALPDYVASNNPKLADISAPLDTFIDHGPKPVFFGHYWFSRPPSVLCENTACLDYSVARKGGLLTAYRWQGESCLSNDNFVSVQSSAK